MLKKKGGGKTEPTESSFSYLYEVTRERRGGEENNPVYLKKSGDGDGFFLKKKGVKIKAVRRENRGGERGEGWEIVVFSFYFISYKLVGGKGRGGKSKAGRFAFNTGGKEESVVCHAFSFTKSCCVKRGKKWPRTLNFFLIDGMRKKKKGGKANTTIPEKKKAFCDYATHYKLAKRKRENAHETNRDFPQRKKGGFGPGSAFPHLLSSLSSAAHRDGRGGKKKGKETLPSRKASVGGGGERERIQKIPRFLTDQEGRKKSAIPVRSFLFLSRSSSKHGKK